MTDEPPQRRIFPDDSPQIESTVMPSKNGRYLIHRTVLTHIKPTAYYEAIVRTANERRSSTERNTEHHEVNE